MHERDDPRAAETAETAENAETHLCNVFILIRHHQEAPVVQKDTVYILESQTGCNSIACSCLSSINNNGRHKETQLKPLTGWFR